MKEIKYCADRSPDIVDLSVYMPKDSNLSKSKLVIPYYYYSSYIQKKNYLTILFGFEHYEIPYQESKPCSDNVLRVHYNVSKKDSSYSHFYTEKIKNEKMEKIDFIEGFTVYLGRTSSTKKTNYINAYFVKKDNLGRHIVIEYSGKTKDPSARPLVVDYYFARCYRYLGDGIELDYTFSDKVNIHNWDLVDKKLLEKIESFQEAYMNYELIQKEKSNKNEETQ